MPEPTHAETLRKLVPDYEAFRQIDDPYVAALKAGAEALETLAQQGWQPIETAPPQTTRALIYWPAFKLNADLEQSDERSPENDLVAEGYRVGRNNWESDLVTEHFEDEAGFGYGDPTHWMPLPSPPTETPK